MSMRRILIPYRHEKKMRPYAEAVRAGGLEAVTVPVTKGPSLNSMDGLLLTGGTDVNPQRYGEAPQRETDEPDDERDAVELALIAQGLQSDLPILAICRGLQVLNVYFGGTLTQHLGSPRHDPEAPTVAERSHDVVIQPGTLLAQVAGAETWPVNSRHHQAVKQVGGGLVISARDPDDGIVEGLEMPGRKFVLAVQWHPEDQIERFPQQLNLFRSFAEACA